MNNYKLVVTHKDGSQNVHDDAGNPFEMNVDTMFQCDTIVSWTFYLNNKEVATIYRFTEETE